MNRPTHKPEDIAKRRTAARKTAVVLVVLAIAIYALFMLMVWNKSHGG